MKGQVTRRMMPEDKLQLKMGQRVVDRWGSSGAVCGLAESRNYQRVQIKYDKWYKFTAWIYTDDILPILQENVGCE